MWHINHEHVKMADAVSARISRGQFRPIERGIGMPCYDSRGDANTPEGRDELLRSFTHNSPLAEIMCELMRRIEYECPSLPVPDAAAHWWKEHKARDAAKAKREAASQRKADIAAAARAKLSPAERKALGID
jgi:hypothetical protein